MKVSENKVVSIIYELRRDNESGDILETLTNSNPLTFLFGRGNLLAKFEDNINGLQQGERFSFNLASEEAYGPVETNAIVDVPIHAFEVDGKIDDKVVKTGNSIQMVDRDGQKLTGIIQKIGKDKVKMDFNHPMAGVDLHFSGEITSIRDASEDEILHGHIHSAGGCSGCSQDSNCGEHC